MTPARATRSGWRVAGACLHALLLREAVARMFGRRAALAWLLLEPGLHLGVLVVVYSALRVRHIAGIETAWWVTLGMLAFFLFQRTAMRSANAIDANKALFAYRQVKPVDTVLARCLLEGLTMVLVATLTVTVLMLVDVRLAIAEPAQLLAAAVSLWALGIGWALCMSVAVTLVPESGLALSLAGMGMMFASGVIAPIGALPEHWRTLLFLNPVAHDIEAVRASASPLYHPAPELSLGYLAVSALALVAAGLAVQLRFEARVSTQ